MAMVVETRAGRCFCWEKFGMLRLFVPTIIFVHVLIIRIRFMQWTEKLRSAATTWKALLDFSFPLFLNKLVKFVEKDDSTTFEGWHAQKVIKNQSHRKTPCSWPQQNSFNKKWFTVIGNIRYEHFMILTGLLLSLALFSAQALSVFTSDHLVDSMSAEAIEVLSI